MVLASGTRLGPYEIQAPLGAGGMGEVYRARDEKLARDVAIKVLPEALAADPEALARFEREARAVAALSHPNILAIHDFARQDGAAYAVMELLEGETLRERLALGVLPVRKAVEQAVQIAQGLAAAHEKGIVHRDLKPENLFVTDDGRVKILDFGLAKPALARGSGNVTKSPTLSRHTEPGQVMGTVGYMSPEQVKGLPADHRSDIFSFGVVLYEMLWGRRAFQKETAAETMTAILREDPPELEAEADKVPAALAQILWHCLEKDPNNRVQSARDLVFDLQLAAGLSSGRAAAAAGAARDARSSRTRWALVALGAVAGALATLVGLAARGRLGRSEPRPMIVLSANLPATDRLFLRPIALSPDGQTLAYQAARGQVDQLFFRALAEAEDRPIPGTNRARFPFFSPDGKWLGFTSEIDAKLRVLPVGGGAARVIDDSEGLAGASWSDDGTIVCARVGRGLLRVSAEGGSSEPLTTLDAKTESGHVWPQVLPGGKAVLFTVEVAGKAFDDARIEVLDLSTRRRRVVIEGGTYGRYVSTGHLVFARASTLVAVPFDMHRLAVSGPGVAVLEGAGVDAGSGSALFDVSPSGTLAYVPGREGVAGRTLQWLDGQGRLTRASDVRRAFDWIRLSPDGGRIATSIEAANADLWIHDLASDTLTRLTFGAANTCPVWKPDGHRLIFSSDRDGQFNLYSMPSDGSGSAERLTSSPSWQEPESVSPDGRTLAFVQYGTRGDSDIWTMPLEGTGVPREFVASPFTEARPSFSPDGRWIAYHSDESGQNEVYLQPFPGPGAKRRVSVDGGLGARWSRDGRELFFARPHEAGWAVMAARVPPGAALAWARPVALTDAPRVGSWDVAPDGRFLLVRLSDEETSSREIRVILNWADELARRVPRSVAGR